MASTEWDPDGAGPLPPQLIVTGWFDVAGNALTRGVGSFDRTTGQWSGLAAGLTSPGMVRTVTTRPNGQLVVGGGFAAIGGVAATNIAAWDGSSWSAFGPGIQGVVYATTTLPNGDLIAAGNFPNGGGIQANNIARWDGTSWSALGSGLNGEVLALATLTNGDLVAGGYFTTAGGAAMSRLARWNGNSWSALGGGITGPSVNTAVWALRRADNGDLFVGGLFSTAGGVAAENVACWDGSNWTALGSLTSTTVKALEIDVAGDLIVGGRLATNGTLGIARWDGTTWHALANGVAGAGVFNYPEVNTVTTQSNGDLFVGGVFAVAGTVATHQTATFDGTNWHALNEGNLGSVRTFAEMPNGDLIVGGNFTALDGVLVDNIARWNGTSWASLGNSFASPAMTVHCLTTLANGDLLAGGFLFAGTTGSFIRGLARWQGTSWSPIGAGIGFVGGDSTVYAIQEMPNGDLIVGGSFTQVDGVPMQHIARWNGAAWAAVGGGMNVAVRALALLPNGDLVAGGDFTQAGGNPAAHIARFDGIIWSAMGAGFNHRCHTLHVRANGELLAGGDLTASGTVFPKGIARWTGTTWDRLGDGANNTVHAIASMPNGDLIAGGRFTTADDLPANRLARWDGFSWVAIDDGLKGNSSAAVYALLVQADATLRIGGQFLLADGAVSVAMARYESTCKALAVATGIGCAGSTTPDQLAAATLPWIGTTQRSVATGLPALAVAVGVRGFTSLSFPLDTIFPQATPGCSLLAAPDQLELHLPSNGVVTTSIDVPASPALVGAQWHEQVVTFEFASSGPVIAITASNALLLTAGSF